ncbi:uncharacterized protein LOC110972432 isoform X4 [Acanthochromis polyacanthus]|nr:uncharacterized protein LOC110972432 isoform X4 [Acanthochromis polyacanthus]
MRCHTVEEEQCRQDEEETATATAVAERMEEEKEDLCDEGVAMEEEDPIDGVCGKHVALTQAVKVEEEDSPALQDVLVSQRHLRLHLPGIEEVEALALLLLELADDEDQHYLMPLDLRQKIITAAGSLHEHDKTAANFVKRYESRWGYTLFGRCLGPDTPESSAAQKTKFGWMRYPQAAQVTEDSRLLYLLIKMLHSRPPSSNLTSPSKLAASIKGRYKRIVDRVRDDPVLYSHSIPLPNINNKSITSFLSREEKKANYSATVQPRAQTHRTVLSDQSLPEAPALPSSLPPPGRPQVQYEQHQNIAEKSGGWTLRIRSHSRKQDLQIGPSSPSLPPPPHCPPFDSPFQQCRYCWWCQPRAPSVQFAGPSCSQVFVPALPPPAPKVKPIVRNKSQRPCGACQVPQCGGMRKRCVPSKEKVGESSQKLFTFCSKTGKSTTPGFEDVVYTSFAHFKSMVDKELERRNNQQL